MDQRDFLENSLTDLDAAFRVPDHSRAFRPPLINHAQTQTLVDEDPALVEKIGPPEVPMINQGMATFIIGGGLPDQADQDDAHHEPEVDEMMDTKQAGTWVPFGEVRQIWGITITRGGYYIADEADDQSGNTLLSHVINLAMPAYPDRLNTSRYYLSHYQSMSPNGRHAYIKWLASAQSDVIDESSNLDLYDHQTYYWRMYVSGLEYRIMVDAKQRNEVSDEEFLTLFQELKRLCAINRLEAHRVYSLIQWMTLMRPKVIKLSINDVLDYHMSDVVRMALCQASHVGKPMPVKSVMAWTLLRMPDISNSSIQMRKIYAHVFKQVYANQHPFGVLLRPSRRQLVLYYHPMSYTMDKQQIAVKGLTDVLSPPSNMEKLELLARAVRQSTSAYRQYVVRNPGSSDSLYAHTLLPDEVIDHIPLPSAESFRQWASDVLYARNGYVRASEVIHAIDPEQVETGNLGKNKTNMIHKAVTLVGYAVAPDPAYHSVALEYDSRIQLIELSKPGRVSIDQHFHEVVMACRFAAVVNSLADQPDPALYDVLTQMLETMGQLTEDQRRVLAGYLSWLGRSEVDSRRLYSHLDEMGEDYDRLFVAKTMVTALAALDSLNKKQLKKVEFFYKKLDLKPDLAFTMLHDSRAGDATVPVVGTAPAPFTLNRESIQRHEQETHQAQALLGDIFSEVNLPDEHPLPVVIQEPVQTQAQLALENDEGGGGRQPSAGSADTSSMMTSDLSYSGLDNAHSVLFQALSSSDEWPMDEVARLCRKQALMTEGALEIINDWAYENADDAVFDVADKLYVHADIATQLLKLQKD